MNKIRFFLLVLPILLTIGCSKNEKLEELDEKSKDKKEVVENQQKIKMIKTQLP